MGNPNINVEREYAESERCKVVQEADASARPTGIFPVSSDPINTVSLGLFQIWVAGNENEQTLPTNGLI